jgi:hypothetical protein
MTKTYAAFALAAIILLSFAAHADAATRKYDPEASMAYGWQVAAPFVRRAPSTACLNSKSCFGNSGTEFAPAGTRARSARAVY